MAVPTTEGRKFYQYQPLGSEDEVRLLILAAGTCTDDIRCDLRPYSLSSIPQFDAISYAWEDISKPHEVFCNNESIPVTRSAYIALQYLRHAIRDRVIWIDAICINQGSDSEKSHQVCLMREIYSQARQTHVWLGEDVGNNAKLAFEHISRLADCLSLTENQAEAELRQSIAIDYHIREGMFEDWALEFIKAIAPVFDQSWFRRLWVVQEVALSFHAKLCFGNHSISMPGFMAVMTMMGAFHELNYHQRMFAFHSMGNLVNMGVVQAMIEGQRDDFDTKQPLNILELLRYTENFAHTDPRDKIYALLGLAYTPGFVIDYSLSTEATFRRFGDWALATFPNLAVLSYSRGVTPSEWRVPSWNPSADMDGLPISLLLVDHYQASGETSDEGEESTVAEDTLWTLNQDNELCLRGILVDTVSEVGKGALNASSPVDLIFAILEAQQIANCEPQDLNDDRYRKFCKAMTLETAMNNTKALPQQAEWFHDYSFALQSQQKHDDENHHTRNVVKHLQCKWARHRWFCRTLGNRFAFVAWRANPGDGIWIIHGSRIPYILRKQADGNFKLVGECWIQGLMEGEGFRTSEPIWDDICLI
jgi:hypothetical protein